LCLNCGSCIYNSWAKVRNREAKAFGSNSGVILETIGHMMYIRTSNRWKKKKPAYCLWSNSQQEICGLYHKLRKDVLSYPLFHYFPNWFILKKKYFDECLWISQNHYFILFYLLTLGVLKCWEVQGYHHTAIELT